MHVLTISFAAASVSLLCRDRISEHIAGVLFDGLFEHAPEPAHPPALSLSFDEKHHAFSLVEGSALLYRGRSRIQCAAVLYDRVIFHLLNHAAGGSAIHCGAVARGNQVILIPGTSGAGKSTLTCWLTTLGYRYLTDELVFISEQESTPLQFFTRPVCLKSGGFSAITAAGKITNSAQLLLDEHGAIIPHRLLAESVSHDASLSASPALIIMPVYSSDSALASEKISKARLVGLLMQCHANARNLENHGFAQIVNIARRTPAYLLSYAGFDGLGDLLEQVLNSTGQK